MGRLTSAYVLSVFREFIENTNQRIEGSLTGRYIRLRLKSLFTGKSYAELLLRETEIFRVQEILLQQQVDKLLDDWLAALRAQGSVRILKPGEEAP